MTNNETQLHSLDIKKELEGKLVTLTGWIYAKRLHGKLIFITLRDSSGLIQITINKERITEEEFSQAKDVTIESSITIKGHISSDLRAPRGVEVQCNNFTINSMAQTDYPIRLGVGKEILLDKRHLQIRSPKVAAILKIRGAYSYLVREWLNTHSFKEVTCPILITAACEGGATLFQVNYFKKRAFLSQSVQLYQEAAIMSLEKVYSIEPSFRAELSRTRRHLTEFWQVEAEAANATLEDIMRIQEQMLTYACKGIAEKCIEELNILGLKYEVPKKPFLRITYDEAVKRLQDMDVKISWGQDFGAYEERVLSKQFKNPFFVTKYPKKCKAFYHEPDPNNSEVTLSVDLLAPEGFGEISGGGQRISDYNLLIQSIEEFGLNPSDYEWYIDLRKYGSVVHSGFGMGIERVIRWILKLSHIRDACLFPRTPARVYP